MVDNEEIDVPSYFLCPISLQIMKDPVTVCTGLTYDRDSIEKWVFTNKHNTCPVTKQALNNVETNNTDSFFLTPNHTLRRLIQSWCALNASYGVERFPTPKPPVSKAEVLKLVDEASNTTSSQRLVKNFEKIKSIAAQSGANKRCLESTPGVAQFLARVIILGENDEGKDDISNSSTSLLMMRASSVSEEALSILGNLQVFDEMVLKNMLKEEEGGIVEALVRIMKKSNDESRGYAVGLMKELVQVAQPSEVAALRREHFIEIVRLIKDNVSSKATKAALKVLALAYASGKNRVRVRVVEAGAVPVMVELLMESNHKRTCEMVLAMLDHLSGCAEGRAELLGHAAGLAVVSKKILRVSRYATQRGIKILFTISKFSGSPSVVQEMLQIGVVTKLCLVLQVECEAKIKEKAREILKLHARAWRNSPCAPPHIFPSIC